MDDREIKRKVSEGYILARIIIEIVGKPAEHVAETLKSHIKKIDDDERYILVKETSEKPEAQDELFSAFGELEILFKNSYELMSFCFDMMPSSVEILDPEKTIIKNNNFTDFLNDMQARLHAVNGGVIELQEKNKFLIKNTAVLLRNFIVVLLSSRPMPVKEMLPFLGVRENDIVKVLDALIKEGKIKKQGDLYTVVTK